MKTTTHICVVGLSGVGKTHFINAVSIGHGYTIHPTAGFYEESFCLDSTHNIHLVECTRIEYLTSLQQSFECLLWILDAHASYEAIQASRNHFLSIAHLFKRVGVIYHVRSPQKPQKPFRKRNKELQLDCFPQPIFVIEIDYSKEWHEKVCRLWYFFADVD